MKLHFANLFPVSVLLFSLEGVLMLAQAQEQTPDSSLKDRFLQDAPERWETYSQKTQELQGAHSFQFSATLENRRNNNKYEEKNGREGRKIIKSTTESSRDGKMMKKTFELFGLNPHYGFILQRENAASPWSVVGLSAVIDHSILDDNFKNKIEKYDGFYDNLVRIGIHPLAEMIQQSEFRILQCQGIRQGESQLVELVFDYSHDVKLGENSTQGGTLILDPKRFWCLLSYKIRTKSPQGEGAMTFRVLKMEETANGLPVARSSILENEIVYSNGQKNKVKFEFQTDLNIPRKIPDDNEFTLSAFGLPEPPIGLGKRPIRWYLWVALGGIICLALAALSRWKGRRATGPTENPQP